MGKVKNADIINSVVSELPLEHSEILKDAKGVELLSIFENYPSTKNAFIEGLQNKVVKSIIYSKSYENSLKELKKGFVEYGDSIEELFVHMAQSKNFNDHWNENGTDEADLIRALKPQVTSLYIQRNFDKDYKTTIFDKVLRKAFTSDYGLNNLIQQISLSINNAIEYHEFKYTKDTIKNFVESFKILSEDDKYISIPTSATKQTISAYRVSDPKDLVKKVRETTGNMKFMSDKYNVAKVKTFSNPEDLVFITTPSTVSDIDVNVLASAFNVSSSDIKTRILQVDELPNSIVKVENLGVNGECEDINGSVTTEQVNVVGVLMDKDLIQIWDNYQGSGTFYNAAKGYTNYFANREGTFATCLFANICVFYK